MCTVDSHLHVWDPARLTYEWLTGDLDAPFAVKELQTARGVTTGECRAVFVEADVQVGSEAAEVQWVSSIAHAVGVGAIVAAVPLREPRRVESLLRTYRDNPLVVGVRQVLHDRVRGELLDAATRSSLQLIAEAELSFDVCVRWSQLEEASSLASEFPEMTFVLDHLGKPPLDGAVSDLSLSRWAASIETLANLPHVACKVSGLPAQSSNSWSADQARALVDHAHAVFGADRLLYGSDWPVSRQRSTTGQRWEQFVEEWSTERLNAAEQEAFWGSNARRVYRVPCAPTQ